MVLGSGVYSKNILNALQKRDLVLIHVLSFLLIFCVFLYVFHVFLFNVFIRYGKYCGKQIIY